MLVSLTCAGRRPLATLPYEIKHPNGGWKITRPKADNPIQTYRIHWGCGCVWEGSRAQIEAFREEYE